MRTETNFIFTSVYSLHILYIVPSYPLQHTQHNNPSLYISLSFCYNFANFILFIDFFYLFFQLKWMTYVHLVFGRVHGKKNTTLKTEKNKEYTYERIYRKKR